MLVIENAEKRFGKKMVLKNINLTLDKGIYGLLGPNGAGKTTLMRCITSLYSLNDGKISYNESDIKSDREIAKRIGYLPQKFGGYKELTLREMLIYFGDLKKVDKKLMDQQVSEALKEVNLTERTDSRIKTLSGGMLRRLGIAQTLLNDPEILIYDEPTAGLDPEERLRFKKVVSKNSNNKIVIISTHIVEDVEALCDNIIVMDQGMILAVGSSNEIKKYAEGKVFECLRSNFSENKDCFVIKEYERDGEIIYRFLSNKCEFGTCVEPNIEDGYLCILKKI